MLILFFFLRFFFSFIFLIFVLMLCFCFYLYLFFLWVYERFSCAITLPDFATNLTRLESTRLDMAALQNTKREILDKPEMAFLLYVSHSSSFFAVDNSRPAWKVSSLIVRLVCVFTPLPLWFVGMCFLTAYTLSLLARSQGWLSHTSPSCELLCFLLQFCNIRNFK